jgi:hypothetical protein
MVRASRLPLSNERRSPSNKTKNMSRTFCHNCSVEVFGTLCDVISESAGD